MQRIVGWVMCVILLVGTVAIAPRTALADSNVEPKSGVPSTYFTFFATGFRGGEKIGVWLNAPDGHIVSLGIRERYANDAGRFDWAWLSPSSAQVGTWQAVARGLDSGLQHVLTFDITGTPAVPNTPPPSPVTPPPYDPGMGTVYNVEPKAGNPGTRFAFFATGFRSNEEVGIWLNAPDGRIVAARGEQLNGSNGDGRADWFWRAPSEIQNGRWQMVARGVKSGLQRIIGFDIINGAIAPAAPGQPAPTPQPIFNVEPKVGSPGTYFSFYAMGFLGGEPVSAWVNTPDGRIIAVSAGERFFSGFANGDGRADVIWKAPEAGPAGQWKLVIHGARSGFEQTIPFEIR